MNHLAHTLLAGPDPEFIVGGVLGDFWRGAPDQSWSANLRAGVMLHRNIDTFTDAHPIVVKARGLFQPPFRRYAGILLDVYFDHLLARNFSRYSGEPLKSFSSRVMQLLDGSSVDLPESMRDFIHYLSDHDAFTAYADPEMIVGVVRGIGRRLRHANPLRFEPLPLCAMHATLSNTFEAFFPLLQEFATQRRAQL